MAVTRLATASYTNPCSILYAVVLRAAIAKRYRRGLDYISRA